MKLFFAKKYKEMLKSKNNDTYKVFTNMLFSILIETINKL